MHYYNLFVHFYFVKTVHSYFIILKKSGYLEMELDFGSKKMDIGSGSKYSQMKKWKIENIQFM